MTIETRLIHASSNGDRWLLVGNLEQGPVVRHEPNRSSGGLASDMSLDEFLQRDGQGPQHDALRFMLAHPIAEAAQDDVESVTPAQIRAGRALLGWSVQRLAKEAQVEPADIERYEGDGGMPERGRFRRLASALAQGGVVMIAQSEVSTGGVGVRLGSLSVSAGHTIELDGEDANDNAPIDEAQSTA